MAIDEARDLVAEQAERGGRQDHQDEHDDAERTTRERSDDTVASA